MTLQIIVVEKEAVLNDRPLTHLSSDLEDDEPLTPSQLLYGRRNTSLPRPEAESGELSDPSYGETDLPRKALLVALLIQHFWQRWQQEYLYFTKGLPQGQWYHW